MRPWILALGVMLGIWGVASLATGHGGAAQGIYPDAEAAAAAGIGTPGSSTDEAACRWDGVGGDTLQDSANGPFFRDNGDVDLDGHSLIMSPSTGSSIVASDNTSMDFKVNGPVRFRLDNVTNEAKFSTDILMVGPDGDSIDLDGGTLVLDADGDTRIDGVSDDIIAFTAGNALKARITSAGLLVFGNVQLNGSADVVFNSTAALNLGNNAVSTQGLAGFDVIVANDLEVDGTLFADGDIDLDGSNNRLIIDADADTHISGAAVDDQINYTVGGNLEMRTEVNQTTFFDNIFMAGTNSNQFITSNSVLRLGTSVASTHSLGNGDVIAGDNLECDGTFFADGNITAAADITSSDTGDIGWSVVAVANQACTTTCTNACVHGFDDGAGTIVDCADATADKCVCAGAS